MVVCRFWQEGTCKFGSKCRFEHPSSNTIPINNNRFGALSTTPESSPRYNNQNRYQNGGHSRDRGNRDQGGTPYGLDRDAIRVDLLNEKPYWILSAYGPGRQAPIQLFGGPSREQSEEEVRLQYYAGIASGNGQAAVQHVNSLFAEAQQQIDVARGDLDGAIRYIINGENQHPNRIDVCANPGLLPTADNAGHSNPFGQPTPSNRAFSGAPNSTANPFGAPAQSSPFGAPSQSVQDPFGQLPQPVQNSNPFGAPASAQNGFGQPSQSGGNAFGQPSQPAGAFGQPAQLGAKPNPFGAPQTSAFGQQGFPTSTPFSAFSSAPSGFAQPPAANPFGQPSQPSPRPAAASPFGQSVAPVANPFGAPVQSPPTNPFGQPVANPFGQPAQSSASPNPFGAASPVTQNPFGQPPVPNPQSPFGAPAQPAQPNPFGQPASPSPVVNPFGAPAAPIQQNPFGAPQPPANTGATLNPFGQPRTSIDSAHSNPFGGSPQPTRPVQGISTDKSPYAPDATLQHPDPSTYSSRDARRQLSMFKGKQVAYKDGEPWAKNRADGKWEKVWFPDGPPGYNKTTELEDDAYDEDTKKAYLYARQTGEFPDGVMPLLPPKREWCTWDF